MEDLIETSHWSNERQERHENILATIGSGELVASFIVDTGHPKGNEIHNIFENGIIMIQN